MPDDTVIKLIQPGTFNDQLTDVLRSGARALLAQAVEAEDPVVGASHLNDIVPAGCLAPRLDTKGYVRFRPLVASV